MSYRRRFWRWPPSARQTATGKHSWASRNLPSRRSETGSVNRHTVEKIETFKLGAVGFHWRQLVGQHPGPRISSTAPARSDASRTMPDGVSATIGLCRGARPAKAVILSALRGEATVVTSACQSGGPGESRHWPAACRPSTGDHCISMIPVGHAWTQLASLVHRAGCSNCA